MKIGDLVRWRYDGDLGLVVALDKEGLPCVKWCGETHFHDFSEEELQYAEAVK